MARRKYNSIKHLIPESHLVMPSRSLDEQLFEICAKFNVPLVAVFGKSDSRDVITARQMHCYCAVVRGLCSIGKAGLSIGRVGSFAYGSCESIDARIKDGTLDSKSKEVLEFYDLI